MSTELDHNIRIYPWYRASSDILAWIPVFFLYLSQQVALSEVITLSAIYYFAVCLLEVPCGLFSDRVGRRLTLLYAAGFACTSYIVFLIGGSFSVLAIAQCFLAAAIALQSGSDTALHYDTLQALGRQEEYLGREARAEKWGLLSLSASTMIGGLLATIDLRFAYVLSLAGGLLTFYIAWQFHEPERESHTAGEHSLKPLLRCIGYLRQPVLLWVFVTMVLMYCLEHWTYEFYQPFLRLLTELPNSQIADLQSIASAPALSGLLVSISMFGGSLGAMLSVRAVKKLGLIKLLLLALLVQFLIVAGLSYSLMLILVLPVMLRNFPMSLIHAPVNAVIAPRVASADRATYLSVQSLASRLVMSASLVWLSAGLQPEIQLDWPTLQGILWRAVTAAGLIIAVIWVTSRSLHSPED